MLDDCYGDINMIKIIAVGRIKEDYSKSAIANYLARIKHYAKLEINEVPEQGMEKEADKILQLIDGRQYAVLEVNGRQLDSPEFAELIKQKTINNQDILFVIGGSDGLSQKVISQAAQKLSLSRMTFAHGMCRVFLLEQIYRAFTIINNQKYHK